MHTEADFTRIRAKLKAGAQPWTDGWQALLAARSAPGYVPRPLATVVRGGDGSNFGRMFGDMQRAYQTALRWKISGEDACAQESVALLNAWSSTMTELTGNADRFLAGGIYGYQWANAAEIMRTYPGWAPADVDRFKQWLLDHFYTLNHQFLTGHNGTETAKVMNYWANWDLCNISSVLAIGVFCDRRDLVDEAVNYYKFGRGMGSYMHNVVAMHPGYLGQWQEAGRDQGHNTLGIALAGPLCEMAWNQGIDLYGLGNNRLLAGAEYVAKCNLVDPSTGKVYAMPFMHYVNNHFAMDAVADGGPHGRPCWELIYNHYVNRQRLSAPWVTAWAGLYRPEGFDGTGDLPSFGTLSFSREPAAAGAPPSGLTAFLTGGDAVLLSWWGSAQATSYNVKRAASPSGPFTLVGSVTDPRTWTDKPGNGVWHYAVTATGPAGESTVSNVARVVVGTELLVHMPLDEGTGGTARSLVAGGTVGVLADGATWGAGRKGGSAVSLDGSGGHVALPTAVAATLGDFTVSIWVNWNQAQQNTRIFDFGFNDVTYMFLAPGAGHSVVRFAASVAGSFLDEKAVGADHGLPTGRWVHVAVTLQGTVGTIYVDGAIAGTSDGVLLAPWQLGATTQNWLGKSQYPSDPGFNGRLQDLRIYSGALSASEITALSAG